jgi:mannosyltransferase
MLPILLLSFLLRVAYLDAQGLWWDEAFSFSMSAVDLGSLLENAVHYRVHPPLYYMLLHFWLAIGHDEFLLRFFSLLFGTISVSLTYMTARLVGGERLAVLAALLFAVSPFNVWYSQEVRMYSLTAMLVLAAMAAFLRVLREDTLLDWAAYGLLTLLALYSDYLHLFVTLGQAVFLVILRKRYGMVLRKWFYCMVVVGVLFLPWAVAVFSTGGFYSASISWIRPAQIPDLFWTVYSLSVGVTTDQRSLLSLTSALIAMALAAYGLLSLRTRPRADQQRVALVLVWFLLPLLFTLLISLDWPLPQKRSIYIDRFFNPLLPAFLILVAFGLLRALSASRVLSSLALAILLITTGRSLYGIYFDEVYVRDQWREAITEINTSAQPGDLALVRPHHYVPVYYYPLEGVDSFSVPYLASAEEYEEFLDREVPPLVNDDGKLWTMIVCENANAHRFVHDRPQDLMDKVSNDELRGWLLAHYQLLDERVYKGVYLASYGTRQGM